MAPRILQTQNKLQPDGTFYICVPKGKRDFNAPPIPGDDMEMVFFGNGSKAHGLFGTAIINLLTQKGRDVLIITAEGENPLNKR